MSHSSMDSKAPAISVIVPLLNEAGELPALFATLARQTDCEMELILCDGGSNDGSQQVVSSLADSCGFPVKMIQSEQGRGRQMNTGAVIAASELLLFLHADSQFEDTQALTTVINRYHHRMSAARQYFAARFSLHFRRSDPAPSLPYFYYEAKARLPRTECIRGDQGFLLSRDLYDLVGGFEESLPFLEDIRLAIKVAVHTDWQLLPTVISTSARRFEREGLLERQTLNAIIVNNARADWREFFLTLPGVYRLHAVSGKIELVPILEGIHRLLEQHDRQWRRTFWQTTGQHVAENSWQLFFLLDVRCTFRNKKSAAEVTPHWLAFYDLKLHKVFLSSAVAVVAQMLTRLWLWWMLPTKTNRTA